MNWFRADLHIHSVLSPCADLFMSPSNIISHAKAKGLDIIAITDHNTTLHSALAVELGDRHGLVVFPGVEVCTVEEIHCLCLFETIAQSSAFQSFIDNHTVVIPNDPEKFGFQILVNEHEEIISQIDNLLLVGLDASIDQVEQVVHRLEGVFIPAHVDRSSNGIYAQLGFLPPALNFDALEFSSQTSRQHLISQHPEIQHMSLITSSDAHQLSDLASSYTSFYLQEPSFKEFRMALNNCNNRTIKVS